ncbi:TraB/GumN family protein [Alkalilimnicola sp. S0819]|uniref:TraB/GumN family protein n=1 Tax=Alkalilimnicola sp. S0819 TaxID=2613922 RepID=UPI0012615179|nr:TraB/GumN family protein [Alkalilimnicola sp. S0819]KAB7627605.1 TraB/GumN family protein [Alkalilimnicola sp. S0819]MPQ15767.1 TraB family protein [Alkalilimnicola sp. S0819]
MDSTSAQPGTRYDIRCGDTRITILGTAHVSQASADEVRALIESGEYDAVALELCEGRRQSLEGRDTLQDLDLFQVIRQGKAGLVAANLALSAYQQRIAQHLEVEPGAEMRAGLKAAAEAGLPAFVVDRDIGITLKRLIRGVPWIRRFALFAELLASLFSREQVSREEIEELKEADILQSAFAGFAERAPSVYKALIEERDRYMAARIRQSGCGAFKHVLLVVGAGHAAGIAELLGQPADQAPPPAAELTELDQVPPPSPWPRRVGIGVIIAILAAFALGFSRSPAMGMALVWDWVLINGVLAALGALLALAHPGTVVLSFLAAPLTSLNPTVGAGMVAAGVELVLRKPKVRDFRNLRDELTRLRGWWRNRVARTLLVFVLVSLGSAVGTYVAGARIAGKLMGG